MLFWSRCCCHLSLVKCVCAVTTHLVVHWRKDAPKMAIFTWYTEYNWVYSFFYQPHCSRCNKKLSGSQNSYTVVVVFYSLQKSTHYVYDGLMKSACVAPLHSITLSFSSFIICVYTWWDIVNDLNQQIMLHTVSVIALTRLFYTTTHCFPWLSFFFSLYIWQTFVFLMYFRWFQI